MPKEVIHNPEVVPGTDNSTPYAVAVQWGRDSEVSIASMDLRDEGKAEHYFFVPVTRKMVNELIRVLRKARDQAYGADE